MSKSFGQAVGKIANTILTTDLYYDIFIGRFTICYYKNAADCAWFCNKYFLKKDSISVNYVVLFTFVMLVKSKCSNQNKRYASL